jgi:triphosphoribosyl-dephospho-CoA synthase
VEATAAAAGTNTNLGIVLLCAPLAAAAEQRPPDLRAALAGLLDGLDIEDARLAFRAIAAASPGGLGRVARHDVHAPAIVSLKGAMAEAADRDRIARQYVSAFEDIFVTGEAALAAAHNRQAAPSWATLLVYLTFLAEFPDTHILRKHGPIVAGEVRQSAIAILARAKSARHPAELEPDLLAWDRALKERNINPGTSADLTVAALFAARLRDILPSAAKSD